jgi:CheY-like chemotaxis protein
MQCPRCRGPITSAPDPGGFLICPGCGARLTTRPAVPAPRGIDNPNATLPPGTRLKKIPRPGEDTARSSKAPSEEAPLAGGDTSATLEGVMAELRSLKRGQAEMLRLLRAQADLPTGESGDDEFDDVPALLPPVRSRLRKTVLLVDDDTATREGSLAELQAADIPVVAFGDGRAALEHMARERPDVIALELDLAGALAGKDVINMIKATMEWVDIPIILYTRAAVESQREARQAHGADDVVLKRSGPAALVSKVVALFRRP